MRNTRVNAKETITFYKDTALRAKASDQDENHITTEYEIVSDEISGDTRTITLKNKDRSLIEAKMREITNMILERLGEVSSKTLKALIADSIRDYCDDDIERIHKKLSTGKESIKTREGCFKVIIGDGRTKNSEHIRLGV